jgi:hypothetical protein
MDLTERIRPVITPGDRSSRYSRGLVSRLEGILARPTALSLPVVGNIACIPYEPDADSKWIEPVVEIQVDEGRSCALKANV